VEASGGVVEIRYPRFSVSALTGRTVAELWLSSAVPWSIKVERGIGTLKADFRELRIREIEVKGGARTLELYLPETEGTVPLRIQGGVQSVRVRRPAGTGVHVQVRGGANEVTLDGQRFGPQANLKGLQTGDSEGAPGYYDLSIEGGLQSLVVTSFR
jgi:hypothetical protein